MANVRAIFQPLMAGHQHSTSLLSLMREPWLTQLVISSAYANSAGVSAVSQQLATVATRCRAFIGVRNGSTTAQAAAALLELGVELFAVDTAMRGRIFHPKLFLATGPAQARAVIGSANLTHAGLFNNIEAGTDIDLDRTDPLDMAFVDDFLDGFADLVTNHPSHCSQITSLREIIDLMKQGLLEDERNPKTNSAFGSGANGNNTSKAKISLPFTKPPKRKVRKPKPVLAAPAAGQALTPQAYGQLVWSKPNLPRSDLQLNAANAPGVLRLTQAGYKVNGHVIDQTTYFRNTVFSSVNWHHDHAAGKDVAVAPISLVIAGVQVGNFDLPLSHKPAWAAAQGNYTTGLHWADATVHIRKSGLIGRDLNLYLPTSVGGKFVIEID